MKSKTKKIILIVCSSLIILTGIIAGFLYKMAYSTYEGTEAAVVIIPETTNDRIIENLLTEKLSDYGKDVYRLWRLRGGKPSNAQGYYIIHPADKAWSIASRILSGQSSTIRVSFNSIRTIDDLAKKLSGYFQWSEAHFKAALDKVLPTKGYVPETFPAAFLPDTYEFYGNATAVEVVEKLSKHTDKFWNSERLKKAKAKLLTPVEVQTLASIVEEEANDPGERSKIASLYLNRLKNGMKLQADPTVKFATGDFSLRRITGQHLQTKSPYNTYLVNGLPPGPIRIADKRSIDIVLDCPKTDYLYMCADETNPGFHNFTADYNEHCANARRYRAWLDSKGIN